ncbi:MFS general substrate transporter [Lepidopterella palustris CBS 459.81]|uniref:MFS general substrate transporter n=1 Tax=Lepidopterella palustris CBS 459.81 TaxID=1314670 RepID=A0A8E2EGB3_9PEZI|nr:MFS general substrate transporter [Lepidopterella palustris CBS 459.81]
MAALSLLKRMTRAPDVRMEELQQARSNRSKWSLGVLNDPEVDEVPGSILLLSEEHEHHEPLGLHHEDQERRASIFPSPYHPQILKKVVKKEKRTKDGKIVLSPQPEDTPNDPLNWSGIKRNIDLLSLGLFCCVGGGMTPILAAGFNDVATTFHTSVPKVALTTGLFMMGLGVGGALYSPTAIIYGKRPVYLFSCVLLIATSVWCALAKSYGSLLIARIVQGMAVSPVEVLPSATIVEIFFLHERASRIGIYEFLYLGGKNLIPLVGAAIVNSLGWRWIFWIVSMVAGLCLALLFFFVPETFWDRMPRRGSAFCRGSRRSNTAPVTLSAHIAAERVTEPVDCAPVGPLANSSKEENPDQSTVNDKSADNAVPLPTTKAARPEKTSNSEDSINPMSSIGPEKTVAFERGEKPAPEIQFQEHKHYRYFHIHQHHDQIHEPHIDYTEYYREHAPKTYIECLKIYNGTFSDVGWFKIFLRPFILYVYPSIVWSAVVYSLSIGWLIVVSETISIIYRNPKTYHFTSLQVGLIYVSPFIGGLLGTLGGGKVSDIMIKIMAKHNHGVYEPEFRLFMVIPVAISSGIGLMGFGWSAQDHDAWVVPTVFFGIIGFGCALGASTAVTFCVDSYRQYAGEALVTLNFSKNILHGLVFSFFVGEWVQSSGSKQVFCVIGGMHLAFLILTIPMFIFGKRCRMWTVRKNFLEKF